MNKVLKIVHCVDNKVVNAMLMPFDKMTYIRYVDDVVQLITVDGDGVELSFSDEKEGLVFFEKVQEWIENDSEKIVTEIYYQEKTNGNHIKEWSNDSE